MQLPPYKPFFFEGATDYKPYNWDKSNIDAPPLYGPQRAFWVLSRSMLYSFKHIVIGLQFVKDDALF